jgi:hypothetical protein
MLMKNNLLRIFYFILLITATSCFKGKEPMYDGVTCNSKCFILTGVLLDSAFNKGIANGEVKFFYHHSGGIFGRTDFIGRVKSDAAGNYRFVMPGNGYPNMFGYFYAEAYKDNMFAGLIYKNQVATYFLDSTDFDKPVVKNLLLFRPATLKLRVIATTVTGFSFLDVDYGYGKGSEIVTINGPRSIDTTFTFKTAGDIRTFISVQAKGNGVNVEKFDTIVIPANNTRQVEIRL